MLIGLLPTLISCIVLNMPLVFAFGITSLVYLLVTGMPLLNLVQKMSNALDSYPLIAVPLFVFAGRLMNTGGISRRLFKFANHLVGYIPGGLGHVNIIASLIFSGMSGNAVADAAGLGTVEIKAMVDEGYDPDFSAAVTAASATIGPIFPPSIPMVIYAVLTGASVGRLFVAGMIPAFLMTFSLMILVYIISSKRNYPRTHFPSFKALLGSFYEAFLPLLAPVIILGGIILGVFTPTEAATVVGLYALVLSVIVYKEVKPKDFPRIIINTIIDSMSAVIILATASVFSWILILEDIPKLITSLVIHSDISQNVFLLIINLILLLLGCLMTFTPTAILILPILLPVLNLMNIDLTHFGVIMVLNLMIGQLTPPTALNLYIVSSIAKISFQRAVKSAIPFILPLAIVLLIITYFPQIVLWLPNLVFGQ